MVQNNSNTDWPLISVIIPFYNNQDEVLEIGKKIKNQSYPSDKVECIFIDNGSDNQFVFPESFLSENILLKENNHFNSPYSARNRGVEFSTGTIIIFVDANSSPKDRWLEEGISYLVKSGTDLVGGKIMFDFQDHVTAGKIVDSLTSINIKKAIKERGAAYTANLFVKKKVFDEIGLFEEGVRSGGDVRWTLKAKHHGFTISYCESAVVWKFARSAGKFYRKRIRTGRGYFYTWKEESARRVWFYNFLRSLKPPRLSKIKKMNSDRYKAEFDNYSFGVWFHLYASGIVEQFTFISEYLRSRLFRVNEK